MFPSFLPAFLIGGGSRRLQPAVFFLLLGIFVCAGPALAFPATVADSTLGGDERWGNEFPPPGVIPGLGASSSYASMLAAVNWQGRLVVQGTFGFIDGTPATNVAMWDGDRWQPLDDWPDAYGVRVAGDRLFAFGEAYASDPGDHNVIWERSNGSWAPVGQGLFGGDRTSLRDLSLLDGVPVVSGYRWTVDDEGHGHYRYFVSRLTAGGWSELGGSALPVMDDYPEVSVEEIGGALYIYGQFTLVDGDTARNVARWNGDRWEPVGAGFDRYVDDLAEYKGEVVAVGGFTRSGGRSTPGIAVWDGEAWTAPGGGLWHDDAPATASYVSADGDSMVVVGWFTRAGDEPAVSLAVWDGNAWHALLDSPDATRYLGLRKPVRVGARWIIPGRSEGYEGLFTFRNGHLVAYPSRGVRPVSSPTALQGDELGLLAAGSFLTPDSLGLAHGVGVWDGRSWRFLAAADNVIYAFARYQGRLVVGGAFDEIGGYGAGGIAMLVDGAWTSMGGGTDGWVRTLQCFDGSLVAAGHFTRAGGADAMNIARWNGAEWAPVGSGANAVTFQIYDLEVYGGDLYACGLFRWMGQDDIRGIARWNGRTWRPLGDASSLAGGEVGGYAAPFALGMTVWNGRLAVVGRFDTAGGVDSPDLALWNGADWEPLERPFGYMEDVLAVDGRLFAGGMLSPSEAMADPSASCLRVQDGDGWLAPGHGAWTGTMQPGRRVEITTMAGWRGDLYVGGELIAVGDRPARYLAVWHGDGGDHPVFRNRLLAGPNPATGPVTVAADLEEPGPGRLRVFDVQGREVARLADGLLPGGERTWTWNLRDTAGRRVAPGVYFLRLDTLRGTASGRLVVLP